MRKEIDREAELRREIAEIAAATAEFEAVAGGLLNDDSVAPSNEMAREEAIELLGVNYVGPEMLGRLLYDDENKFLPVDLDFVKLREVLNEPDEWESSKKRFETYALVFKPPISFLELKAKANEAASAQGKTPTLSAQDWYETRAFATESSKTGSWELVRRETVLGSTSRDWVHQKALIADKPTPTTTSFAALAALLVGQYLEHGIKLYDGKPHYGRTYTCAASGGPVILGDMHADGAGVFGNAFAYVNVGLAVSRNIN